MADTTDKRTLLRVQMGTEESMRILKALASEPRQRILALLHSDFRNVSEIARDLGMPISTANIHVNALEEAGLLLTDVRPARRGTQKVCTKAFEVITIELPTADEATDRQTVEVTMPIGGYSSCSIAPTCGLAGRDDIIGTLDNPRSFYEPARFDAQILWFHYGHVEYHFPNRLPAGRHLSRLHFSAEICSEAPMFHEDWPSDITLSVNGVEIGTWTSPADFGDQRGIQNPEWWSGHNTQYGLLKMWQVRDDGSFIDGVKLSDVSVRDLRIAESTSIAVRLEVNRDSRHVGGLNLFGKGFGNYPQDLLLRLDYE